MKKMPKPQELCISKEVEKKKKTHKSFDIHQPPSRAVGKLSFE